MRTFASAEEWGWSGCFTRQLTRYAGIIKKTVMYYTRPPSWRIPAGDLNDALKVRAQRNSSCRPTYLSTNVSGTSPMKGSDSCQSKIYLSRRPFLSRLGVLFVHRFPITEYPRPRVRQHWQISSRSRKSCLQRKWNWCFLSILLACQVVDKWHKPESPIQRSPRDLWLHSRTTWTILQWYQEHILSARTRGWAYQLTHIINLRLITRAFRTDRSTISDGSPPDDTQDMNPYKSTPIACLGNTEVSTRNVADLSQFEVWLADNNNDTRGV